MATSPALPPLTVYYNGACPLCRREIDHYRHLAQRHGGCGLQWADIHAHLGTLQARGIDYERARRRLHAVESGSGEGVLLEGVDAFRGLWLRLPPYRWLGKALGLGLLRTLAWGLYEGLLAPLLYRYNRWRDGACDSCRDDS
ncbi:MAG: thiol-disulfide oxidoreductase DCC family protein [Candidatus Competibacterales bacterium]